MTTLLLLLTPPLLLILLLFMTLSLAVMNSPSDHPFKPIRLELTRSLLQHMGLLLPHHQVIPHTITDDQLLSMHDTDYIEMVKMPFPKAKM